MEEGGPTKMEQSYWPRVANGTEEGLSMRVQDQEEAMWSVCLLHNIIMKGKTINLPNQKMQLKGEFDMFWRTILEG